MKSIILVALALVAVAVAAPAEPTKILKSVFEASPEGSYDLAFETDDGTTRNEKGELKAVVDDEKNTRYVVVIRGTSSYVNPDGKVETINYEADENGYRAFGDSIPKVPARR